MNIFNKIYVYLFLLITCVVGSGVESIDETNSWDSSSLEGWSHTAPEYSATISSTNGQLELIHKTQSMPSFVADKVMRPVAPGSLLEQITFTLEATDVNPSRVRLLLHSAVSDVTWQLQLELPDAGEALIYTIPVEFTDGWTKGVYNSEDEDDFLQDLRSIDWIGVEILRNASTFSQIYALDDFQIKGVQFSSDNDMDYMSDAWEDAHGLNPNDFSDAELDADGDGMSNYAEYRAGTDPNLASSRFELKIENTTGGTGTSFKLQWNSISNRWYTVQRATNLVDGFTVLETGIQSLPPINIYQDVTATNAPAYFYKIEVEPEI